MCSISTSINITSPWNGGNFCKESKKYRGKHESWSIFEKKLGIPPDSVDGSFVMIILREDPESFRAFKYNFLSILVAPT